MRVVVIVGNNLRHIHFANSILDNFNVVGLIEQQRDYNREKNVAGDIKLEYSGEDANLMNWHFSLRESKEREYFGRDSEFRSKKETKRLYIQPDELSSAKTVEFIRSIAPDVVIVYGTGLLKQDVLSVCPKYTINCHAGLSPWYKGAATLFWPIYFMEPEKAGVTFHLISLKIDGGDIIHQCRPDIFHDDTVHDIGCRAIVVASEDVVKLLKKLETAGNLSTYSQRQGGKIFSKWDFRPHHLRVIKWLMDNKYLEEYLCDKDSLQRRVNLISQV